MTVSAKHSSEALIWLLGWSFADSGKKYCYFTSTVNKLGTRVNMSCTSRGGHIRVGNTETRVKDLVAQLEVILKKNRPTSSETAALSGRMTFAKSVVSGHFMKAPMKELYNGKP